MRYRAGLFLALLVQITACGESGSNPVRPPEVEFRVLAATNTPFRVIQFQTSNGRTHRFDPPGRTLSGPYSFFFVNSKRPVSGTFAGAGEDTLEDVRLQVRLAFEQADETVTDQATLTAGSSDERTVTTQDGDPRPVETAAEIRIEVTAASGAINIPFTATIADDFSTFISCGVSAVCGTPAIFYFEEPRDKLSANISKLVGDEEDILVMLYVNGALLQSARANADEPNARVNSDL